MFEDEDGQQYELEQDAYVTFGDRDDLEVTVLGQRLVITEGETVRLVEELSLIEEEKKEAVTGADVEETIDTSEPNFLDRLLRFFHF